MIFLKCDLSLIYDLCSPLKEGAWRKARAPSDASTVKSVSVSWLDTAALAARRTEVEEYWKHRVRVPFISRLVQLCERRTARLLWPRRTRSCHANVAVSKRVGAEESWLLVSFNQTGASMFNTSPLTELVDAEEEDAQGRADIIGGRA